MAPAKPETAAALASVLPLTAVAPTVAALAVRDFSQWAGLAAAINALSDPPLLPARTGKQIRDRWVNFLNPALNRRPWSREEDARLWRAHAELGNRWTEIGVEKFHTTRSENQVKNRWHSAAFKRFVSEEYGKDAYEEANCTPTVTLGCPDYQPPLKCGATVARQKKRLRHEIR